MYCSLGWHLNLNLTTSLVCNSIMLKFYSIADDTTCRENESIPLYLGTKTMSTK